MAQRIRGQEIDATVVVNGVPTTSFTDIRSFEVTPRFELLEEEYLGETSMRFDEIFNGVAFTMELHLETAGALAFIAVVKARAQRRTPGTTINVKATLNFPNGQRPRVVLKDCFFSDFSLNFASRSDYGTLRVEGRCTDFQVIGGVALP